MIDRPRLDRMLARLQEYVEVLRDLAQVPQAKFLADAHMPGNAKYHFVIAIEACIDIANHIIASQGFRLPKDNSDSFVVLVEHEVLPEELRQPLKGMARFRNRLVHLYWDVDDELVYRYLQDSLADIEGFIAAVARTGS